jgi:hypothetical protein
VREAIARLVDHLRSVQRDDREDGGRGRAALR